MTKPAPIDPAASPQWAVAGRIVTLDRATPVIPDGVVWAKDASIAALTPRGASPPPGFDGVVPVETGGTIFPGLIELHNHIAYNVLPLWQVPKLYTNRDTWGNSTEYHQLVTAPMKTIGEATDLLPAVVRYVELKAPLGGGTTTQGIALFSARASAVITAASCATSKRRVIRSCPKPAAASPTWTRETPRPS